MVADAACSVPSTPVLRAVNASGVLQRALLCTSSLHTQLRDSPAIFFSGKRRFLYWDHLLGLNIDRFGAHGKNLYCISAGIINL